MYPGIVFYISRSVSLAFSVLILIKSIVAGINAPRWDRKWRFFFRLPRSQVHSVRISIFTSVGDSIYEIHRWSFGRWYIENGWDRWQTRLLFAANLTAENKFTVLDVGWAWIFILEGIVTVLAGLISYWIIQDFPDTAKFLGEEERMLRYIYSYDILLIRKHMLVLGVFVIRRLQDDMQFSAAGEPFKRKYIWNSLMDWKTWIASRSPSHFYDFILTQKQWVFIWGCECPITMAIHKHEQLNLLIQ